MFSRLCREILQTVGKPRSTRCISYKGHKIAPPHSYIDVRDFKSPKHLAEYLRYLDKNENAYLSYFDWRRDYTVVAGKRSSIDVFCHLCRYMHTNNTARVAKNFRDWFFRQSECRNPDPEINFH